MTEWYYAEDGEHQGPVDEDSLRAKLHSGTLHRSTLVWTSAMSEWAPASALPAFGAAHDAPVAPSAIPPPVPVDYAGFWKRGAAMFIDNLIFSFVSLLFMSIVVAVIVGIAVSSGNFEEPTPEQINSWMLVGYLFFYIVPLLLAWPYYALFECSRYQATPGKLAIGICVTDLDGGRIGFGRASGRYFGKMLSAMVFYVGFIMAAFTDRKQALHDLMAGCLVVNKPPPQK